MENFRKILNWCASDPRDEEPPILSELEKNRADFYLKFPNPLENGILIAKEDRSADIDANLLHESAHVGSVANRNHG